MLKIPQKVDHALLLMRHLAEGHATARPVSLEEVAKRERISQGYLEEVARLLRTAGLISGRRGVGGGYTLARKASDMTVADVITAMEGKTWSMECLGLSSVASAKEDESPKEHRVSANDALWRKVQGQVMATLHSVTIAEIVREWTSEKETV